MKTILYPVLISILLFSCKKHTENFIEPASYSFSDPMDPHYLNSVQTYLKQHMDSVKFNEINFEYALLSKESSAWYLRFGYRNHRISERFLLLSTGSLGQVNGAREVILKKDQFLDWVFNGTIQINSLQGDVLSENKISNGFMINDRVRQPGKPTVNRVSENMFIIPAPPVEDLPEVFVIGYLPAGSVGGGGLSYGSYLSLSGLIGTGGGSGGSGPSAGAGTYPGTDVPIGGGSGTYSPLQPAERDPSASRTLTGRPVLVNMENSYTKAAIDLAAFLKCFTSIPDAGAGYSINLMVDLPVNSDPAQVFNPFSGATGHVFLELIKTNGSQTITQNVGFTATKPMTAMLSNASVAGKMVDNAGHKYNAILLMQVNNAQFKMALTQLTLLAPGNYDIVNFNCVDFALRVVNSFRISTPLNISKYILPGMTQAISTPEALYYLLDDLKRGASADAPHIVNNGTWNAGVSHGPCN